MTVDRRHKGLVTRLAEVGSIISSFGVVAVLALIMRIGEYKATFANMCAEIKKLSLIMDAHAEQNTRDFIHVRDEISKTKQAVAAATGKQIQ